jgi:diguanylate cyclase (GGDEF)-like protein/PAS domain S-box-containing protein
MIAPPESAPPPCAALYRALFRSASDIVFTLEADGRITSWNPAFERLIGGGGPTGVLELAALLPAESRTASLARVREAADGDHVEIEVAAADGGTARFDVAFHQLSPAPDSSRLAVGRDVTAERASERMDAARRAIGSMLTLEAPIEAILERLTELVDGYFPGAVSAVSRASHGKLRYVAGRLPEGFRAVLSESRIGPMNGSAGTAAHLERPVVASDIATDPTWSALGPSALQHGFQACWSTPVLDSAGVTLGTFDLYFQQRLEVTHERLELLKSAAVVVAGAIQHHARTEEAQYRANHDLSTHLPNRYALERRLADRIAAHPEQPTAVLCVGLGSVKLVNDTFGQSLGDEFLRSVGARLSCGLCGDEMLARVGDDKLAILLPEADAAAAAERAREARDELSDPVVAAGRELFPAAAVGISVYPDHGSDPEHLVSNAIVAVKHGQRDGGMAVTSFAPAMLSGMTRRLGLRNELHRALLREEFALHFQPQFNLRTGELVGQEALLRWDSRAGAVAPSDFIPVAEETGLILPLGDWTLRHACRFAAAAGRPVRCAVNISAVQLAQPDFVEKVVRILEETGLPPRLLDLELTETALMRDLDTAAERMLALRVLGVTLSVDDFGAGYSSLSRLRQLPLDSLKIDLSFVREIVDSETPPTVQAIVALGRGLGMNVIAEGVETPEQLRVLRRIGCDEGQGYLLGRPAPASSRTVARLITIDGISPSDRRCFGPSSGRL